MRPTAAERRGLEQLEQENPGYTATLNAHGIAELTPLTAEELEKRAKIRRLAQRAEVFAELDAA